MSFVKRMLLLTLLSAAASLSAAAQESMIKFKLMQETQVGSAVLPAGEYRMVLFGGSGVKALVTSEDRRGTSAVAIPTSYGTEGCTNSTVTLAPNGSELAMTSACFSGAGLELYFPVSRSKKSVVATQTTASAAPTVAQ